MLLRSNGRFETFDDETKRHVLSLYENKTWQCCGSRQKGHDDADVQCWFLSGFVVDQPETAFDRPKRPVVVKEPESPTVFEMLSRDEQKSLILRCVRFYQRQERQDASPIYRLRNSIEWKCCLSHSKSHTGQRAATCKRILNKEPIDIESYDNFFEDWQAEKARRCALIGINAPR